MKTNQLKFTPYAIAGLIIIIIIMVVFGNKTVAPAKNQAEPSKDTKVTLENEFAQNNLDQTAQQQEVLLTVSYPVDGSTVTTSRVNITGKTLPNAEIFVNEIDAKADSKGNFSVPYTMEEGENYLIVGANDDLGNFKETNLSVYYGV